MCCDTNGAELGKNESPVLDDRLELCQPDAVDEFVGAEGPFSRGTPDVDPFCIKHQQPYVQSCEVLSYRIDGEFVVSGDENIRSFIGSSDSIQSWIDPIVISSDPHEDHYRTKTVGQVDVSREARDHSSR